MSEILDGLLCLLFKFEVISIEKNEYAVAIFSFGCAFFGLLAVIIDVAFYNITNSSLLNIEYKKGPSAIFILSWIVGAMILGYIGQVANIFQISLFSCLVVGFTWPVIFTELVDKIRKSEEIQQPTQEV